MMRPFAPVRSISSSTSFWKASTTVSCRSIWIVASSVEPSLRMGIAPEDMNSDPLAARRRDLFPDDGQREFDSLGKLGACMHTRDFHAELNHRTCDRRRNSRKNRLRPQQLHSRGRFQDVV